VRQPIDKEKKLVGQQTQWYF